MRAHVALPILQQNSAGIQERCQQKCLALHKRLRCQDGRVIATSTSAEHLPHQKTSRFIVLANPKSGILVMK